MIQTLDLNSAFRIQPNENRSELLWGQLFVWNNFNRYFINFQEELLVTLMPACNRFMSNRLLSLQCGHHY